MAAMKKAVKKATKKATTKATKKATTKVKKTKKAAGARKTNRDRGVIPI